MPAWRKFLAQFHDVLVILLLIATAVSAGLWVYERESALPYEAMVIFAVVLLNAVMGYIQQSRAEHAVVALRQMSAAHATVIRDGARQSVAATEVVPGSTSIVTTAGATISRDAVAITPSCAAEIVTPPVCCPRIAPGAVTTAFEASLVLQVAVAVRSRVAPSDQVPTALSCREAPTGIDALGGEIAIETSLGAVTESAAAAVLPS